MAEQHESISLQDLVNLIDTKTKSVKDGLQKISGRGDEISLGDAFEMQYAMQMLTHVTEMSNAVCVAAHQANMSVTRGIKGQ